MEERIRQRLVGAIVLIALLVIFVPMLFDKPTEGWLSREHTVIPPRPPLATPDHRPPLSVALPPAPSASKPAPSTAAAKSPGAAPPKTAASPGAATTAGGDQQLAAWVVQVGSFSSEKNALKLRDQLRAKGFPAFIDKSEDAGKLVARVQVGPEIDQDHAKAVQDRLLKEQKLHGIIVRHR